jgi:hypothetical protein
VFSIEKNERKREDDRVLFEIELEMKNNDEENHGDENVNGHASVPMI